MKIGSSVNCTTSGFIKLVLHITKIYHVLFHYFVVKFSCLHKSVLLFTVQWKLVALFFPSKLFIETNTMTFKQFISVSYKMCRMDIAENYALVIAYYKNKSLTSFKSYVVLYQY